MFLTQTSAYRQTDPITPYLKDCTLGACGRIIGKFMLPLTLYTTLLPESKLSQWLTFPKNFSRLNASYINKHPEFKLKAERLLSRVEEIRKKMQLPQVNVIISSDDDTSARCFGTRHSWTPIVVSINKGSFIEQTDEEIDAQIAHELSHAWYSDSLKDIMFSTSILIADIIGYYFSPLAVPAIEMASAPINWYLDYQKEKAADLKGMEVLNTSKGFVALRKTQLAQNILLSKVPGINITSQGDSLNDISHPPLTERLAYAEAFKPA